VSAKVNEESLPALVDQARKAVTLLPEAQRLLLGRLILRQLAQSRIVKEFVRYGLEGTMKLCTARALSVYVGVFGIVGLTVAIVGSTVAAIPFIVLLVITGFLAAKVAISAEASGRRWRATSITGPSEP
jgi:uncharacterized membrane protein